MIAAVTGAGGFIGRRLVARLLAEGHRVRTLSRQGAGAAGTEVFRGDLGRDGADRLAGFVDGTDILFHCAGEVRDEARMEAVHVRGTRDLAAAAAGRVGRFVHLSSVGAYGPVREGVVDESHPLRPVGTYEVTKAGAEAIVAAAAAEGHFEAAILRPSIVLAADMPNDSVRRLAAMIRRGLFFFVGTPGASANYVHADDVAEALLLLGRPGADGAYNVSDWATVEAFAAALARGIGARPPRLRLPEGLARAAAAAGRLLPGFPLTPSRVDGLTNRALYSSERIEALGFALRHPLEEAAAAIARAWWPR